MPRVDFPNISDIADFAPLPDGDYRCKITDIENDRTKSGDEMWKLQLTVQDGGLAGRVLFDNLVFSKKAQSRVKLLCGACGIDTTAAVDLDPSMLLDKQAMVSTHQVEYMDDQGRQKVANRVRFDGYAHVPAGGASTPF